MCADMGKLLYTDDGCATWQIKTIIGNNETAYDVKSMANKGWIIQTTERQSVNSQTYDLINIYTCDNDFNCTSTYSGENFGEFLRKINDSTYCFWHNDSLRFSNDYGKTWISQKYTMGGKDLFFEKSGTVFSIANNIIFKGSYNLTVLNFSLHKQSNRQYQVSVSNISNAVAVDVYVKDAEGRQTKIAAGVHLQNGTAYNLTIPEHISAGTYTIVVTPLTTGYASVQSQAILIETDVALSNTVGQECFTIKGNTMYVLSHNTVKIYTILGVPIPIQKQKAELQLGVYIVQSECGVKKIVVK